MFNYPYFFRMNRCVLFFIVAIFFISCGGGGGASTTSEQSAYSTRVNSTTNDIDQLPIDPITHKYTRPVIPGISQPNSSGGGVNSSSNSRYGVLVDSYVNGIEYKCGKISGITGYREDNVFVGSGYFHYTTDCGEVEFKLGKITIGTISVNRIENENGVVFPQTLANTNYEDVNNSYVTKIAVFLQSIDKDNNPDNGIDINNTTLEKFKEKASFLDISSNKVDIKDINKSLNKTIGKVVVDTNKALAHLENIVKKSNIIPPSVPNMENMKYFKIDLYDYADFNITGEPGSQIFLRYDFNESNFKYVGDISSNGDKVVRLYFDDRRDKYSFSLYLQDPIKPTLKSKTLTKSITYDNDPPDLDFEKYIQIKEDENITDKTEIKAKNETSVSFKIISKTIDPRSVDYDKFILTQIEGKNTKLDYNRSNPIYKCDSNDTPPYQVDFECLYRKGIDQFNIVADAMDLSKNHTEILVNIKIQNILDNPPGLTQSEYFTNLLEEDSTANFYDFSTSLIPYSGSDRQATYPDNDPALSPKYYSLENDYDGTFSIDRDTGKISVVNKNADILDYEKNSYENSIKDINLTVCVENNNTLPPTNQDLNYANTADTNKSCSVLWINILNKIDTCPKFETNNTTSYSVKEVIEDISWPLYIDKDKSDKNLTMNFSISSGNTNDDFNLSLHDNNETNNIFYIIDKISGSGNIRNNLDYETTKEYNLTIKAQNTMYDNSTCSDEVNISVNVENIIDNPPSIASLDHVEINESVDIGTNLGDIKTNGTGIDDRNISGYETSNIYKYNGSSWDSFNKSFHTIENNGSINTDKSLLNNFYDEKLDCNSKTIYQICVKAYNISGVDNSRQYSREVCFDINITNVIDNIPVLKPQTSIINKDENSSTPTGTLLFTVETSGSNCDENNVTSFNIVNELFGYSDKFEINSTNGEIKNSKLLNFEDNIDDRDKTDGIKSYILKVNATNRWYDGNDHNSSEISVKIDINNTIELPPKIKIYSFNEGIYTNNINIPEAINKGEIVGAVEIDENATIDERQIDNIELINDGDGNFSLSFINDPRDNVDYKGDKFKIGYIVLENSNLDYETNNSYNLEVKATNDNNDTIKDFNISIEDTKELDIPTLLIAVNLDDININETDANLKNIFFDTNNPSVNDYLQKNLNGKITITKAKESYDTSDDGFVKVDGNGSHPENDADKLDTIVVNSLNNSDDDVNYTKFDTNNNGIIDNNELNLIFIIAGGDINMGDTNKSIVSGFYKFKDTQTIDDVNITNYIAIGEKNGDSILRIGLPSKFLIKQIYGFDYQYDHTSGKIDSKFDLLGDGYKGYKKDQNSGDTPVNISAIWKLYSKTAIAKVLKPHAIYGNEFNLNNTRQQNYTLQMSGKGFNNIIRINTDNPKIYYLIENRDSDGAYDDGLAFGSEFIPDDNKGLVIWKVDKSTSPMTIYSVIYSTTSSDRTLSSTDDLSESDKNIFEIIDVGSSDSEHQNQYSFKIEVK